MWYNQQFKIREQLLKYNPYNTNFEHSITGILTKNGNLKIVVFFLGGGGGGGGLFSDKKKKNITISIHLLFVNIYSLTFCQYLFTYFLCLCSI